MAIERIVYSVSHLHENAKRVIKFISPHITARNKVGIEVPEAQLKLYDEINARGLSSDNSERVLLDAIIKKYDYDLTGTEKELPQPLSTAIFWQRLYNNLTRSGVKIKGLGSEKRIRLLNMYAADDSPNSFLMYYLIAGPHFDNLLTERILENGLDRIVVGMGHATKIANRIGSKLAIIDRLTQDLRECNEGLEREYLSGKHELPDLKD